MAERRHVGARLLFIVLVIVNALFFAYWKLSAETRAAAAGRIANLQINPTRIKLIGTASRGPGGQTPKAACLEWGPFAAPEAAKAEAALARLALSHPPLQRTVGEVEGVRRVSYFLREPDSGTVARIADLQRTFPDTAIKAGPCPS